MRNDFITKQDAIHAIRKLYPVMPVVERAQKKWFRKHEQFIKSEEAIDALQPIKRNMIGRWILRNYVSNVFVCSECLINSHTDTYSYCPWCGAQMRRELD